MRLSGDRLKFNYKFIFLIARLINHKIDSKVMSDNEKHPPVSQPNSTSIGEPPEAGQDCLEGLKSKAREIVYQTPEVRPEKVARLKEAIDQGTYEIDFEKLADILIEELGLKR